MMSSPNITPSPNPFSHLLHRQTTSTSTLTDPHRKAQLSRLCHKSHSYFIISQCRLVDVSEMPHDNWEWRVGKGHPVCGCEHVYLCVTIKVTTIHYCQAIRSCYFIQEMGKIKLAQPMMSYMDRCAMMCAYMRRLGYRRTVGGRLVWNGRWGVG